MSSPHRAATCSSIPPRNRGYLPELPPHPIRQPNAFPRPVLVETRPLPQLHHRRPVGLTRCRECASVHNAEARPHARAGPPSRLPPRCGPAKPPSCFPLTECTANPAPSHSRPPDRSPLRPPRRLHSRRPAAHDTSPTAIWDRPAPPCSTPLSEQLPCRLSPQSTPTNHGRVQGPGIAT